LTGWLAGLLVGWLVGSFPLVVLSVALAAGGVITWVGGLVSLLPDWLWLHRKALTIKHMCDNNRLVHML
jgi:hypothetical protein